MEPRSISLSRSPKDHFLRVAASCMAVILLCSAFVAIGLIGGVTQAQARPATGGSGLHKGLIDWFEWGATPNLAVNSGTTKTTTRVIDGQTLATTCTLSNLSGLVHTYRPGTWNGDGLDDLYNIGGTGANNQLITGLSNTTNGATISFDISCAVTLNGVSVPLPGLVMADAEASNLGQGEYIEATPATPASWRIIDRYRNPACTVSTEANLDATGKLRLSPDANACANANGQTGTGPMTVAFMEGATKARVAMKGGGVSAIALGVVLAVDYGDAPATYGEAGSIFASGWTGGLVPTGTTKVSNSTFALGSPAQPSLRLGNLVDAEGAYQASADARLDDTTGSADEDGIVPPVLSVTPGQAFTLPAVSCSGSGVVVGWIDWNRNGTFDAGEGSASTPCAGGAAALTWAAVPANTVHSSGTTKTFMRLRIAPNATAVSTATGLTTAGEVEDYAINVEIPQLSITKTSTATTDSRPGDTVSYTVRATNTGKTAYSAAYPAVVTDDLTNVVDDANYNANAVATPTGTLTYTAPKLRWSAPLAANATMTLTYSVTLGSAGNGVIRNVAYAGTGPTPACAPPTSAGVDSATGVACAQSSFALPRLSVDKTASAADLPAVNTSIQYTVKVTNTGPGVFTAAKPATMSDDLSEVLDDGSVTSISSSTGTSSIVGQQLRWTGVLGAGENATITYSVLYTGAGNRTLANTACVPVALSTPGIPACSTVVVPAAFVESTKSANPVSGTVLVPGQQVSYTLTFKNTGTSRGLVDSKDALAGVTDDAVLDSASIKSTGGVSATWEEAGKNLSVKGFVQAGTTATVTYTVTVKESAFGDAVLRNFLLAAGESPPTTCVPSTNRCTAHPVKGLWALSKASAPSSGTLVSPNDEITYTVTAKGQGGPVSGVMLKDTLTDVLDDATYVPGSGRIAVGAGTPVVVADPVAGILTTNPFDLAVNATATLSYKVKVKDTAWSTSLRNVVTGQDGTGTGPASCESCQTLHTTTAKLLIEKIGETSASTWVKMPGSQWAILQDTDAGPGTVIPELSVEVQEMDPAVFELRFLKPGSYWLTEPKAPDGFSLLAEPVKFTVAANGTVTLGQGAAVGVVSVAQVTGGINAGRSLITVRDVPALKLPESGGPGATAFTVTGVALLLLFAALATVHRTRTRFGASTMD